MELDSRIAQRIARGADPTDDQFRLLVSSITDYAIFVLDVEGRVMTWNPGAERIKGYRADEIVGRHFSVFYSATDRMAGVPENGLRKAERAGRSASEGWRLRKDGSRFWAEVVITALRDENGALSGYAKVTRDMTARHLEREREQMLATTFDYAPNGIALADPSGRYLGANPSFLQLLGYDDAELAGRTLFDLTHPDDRIETARALEDLLSDEAVQREMEKRYLKRDGGLVWVRETLGRILDADGRVSRLVAQVEDITARRAAEEQRRLTEQALREQRTLLAEAQKMAGLGSWEWSPESGRISWSDELYRIYGVTPESFEPSFEGYLARVHPEDRQQSGATVARALIDGLAFSMEERIVRPGGEIRYLRSQGDVVRGEQGKPVKVLGACLDVTEQRHSERALRQAAQDLHALTRRLVKTEEAERRRVARELHDRVGQSLSALNMNLDMVQTQLAASGAAPAEVGRRLADSAALVDRTLEAIETVMADLRPPLLEEYGLSAALGWYGEEYSRRTGIRVSVAELTPEASKALPLETAVALFRIAQEALNNAAKHARPANVRIEIARASGEVSLTVHDDGRGFDPAAARRGRWGMTTMRERAEAAGGWLSVDAAPGRGARIEARVPASPG